LDTDFLTRFAAHALKVTRGQPILPDLQRSRLW
jgi:hypothetical protein